MQRGNLTSSTAGTVINSRRMKNMSEKVQMVDYRQKELSDDMTQRLAGQSYAIMAESLPRNAKNIMDDSSSYCGRWKQLDLIVAETPGTYETPTAALRAAALAFLEATGGIPEPVTISSKARDIFMGSPETVLNAAQSEAFVEAMTNPPEPNEALKEAAKQTPHPFVSTPNEGPCSSCGQKRSASVHSLETAKPEIETAVGEITITPRTVFDYHIVLGGKRFDANDLLTTLLETCGEDGSDGGGDSYITDERMVEALKGLKIIAHGGNGRLMMPAQKGENYDYFVGLLRDRFRSMGD